MHDQTGFPLPSPARYFPLSRGRFTVAPGLSLLTTSFGNGAMDARLFQIDRDFPRFRANALATKTERRGKYVCFEERFAPLTREVCAMIMVRLCTEYPALFELAVRGDGGGSLRCNLTGERLSFDRAMTLMGVESAEPRPPDYENLFDALVSQVPEDVAVVALPEGEPDANVALHATAPSHWAPEEKIGASFLSTHAPVPGFERIADASASLLETVRTRPPVVRFNWGIEFTDRLNLHPEPPPGIDTAEWNQRRVLEGEESPIFLRIERQVLWGMENARALLFAIRIYCLPVIELSVSERDAVLKTLLSMPEESRSYKGLPPDSFADVIQHLAPVSDLA